MSTAAIAAAAAAKKRKDNEEEEKLTNYQSDDLNGWEFKIVRSNTAKFKNPEAVRQLCSEEAQTGWEMIEKFDNNRIRFKRRIENRSRDQHAKIDPYRTSIGIGEGGIVLWVLGGIAILVIGIWVLASYVK